MGSIQKKMRHDSADTDWGGGSTWQSRSLRADGTAQALVWRTQGLAPNPEGETASGCQEGSFLRGYKGAAAELKKKKGRQKEVQRGQTRKQCISHCANEGSEAAERSVSKQSENSIAIATRRLL